MTEAPRETVKLISDADTAFGVMQEPDGTARVAIVGHLLYSNRLAFKQLVLDEVERGRVRIVLDLTTCGTVDSSGLGILVSLARRIADAGGTFRLEGLNPDLVTLLELTKLEHLFTWTPAPAKETGDG